VLNELVEVARQHRLIVFADEIYDKTLFDGETHTSIASLADDVFFVTFNGLSKNYRACGYRAGWMVVSGDKAGARDYIEGLDMLASMRLCSNTPGQLAIQTALGGYQSIKDLVACRNGGYVIGHPDDVKELGSDGRRGQGLVVAEARLQRVEASLKRAFMMSNVRDSERTTAEEIRMVAQQMDEGQVGIYSILTTEFQNPYITRKLHVLTREGKIQLPKDLVKPVVSVGLAAVGRGNDLEKMMRFIQGLDALAKIVGEQEVAARVDVSDAITRLSNGLGLESIDLVLSEEKVKEIKAQQAQAAQQQQLMQSPMADPAKLATAAATAQQMQGEPPPPQQPPEP
jgi:hypothetical protein